jgi:hypothetical protein
VVSTKTEQTGPKAPEKKVKRLRKIRLTDRQWSAITREATREGLSAPEALRRIVDLHLIRGTREKAIVSRCVAMEQRISNLEERMAKSEAAVGV